MGFQTELFMVARDGMSAVLNKIRQGLGSLDQSADKAGEQIRSFQERQKTLKETQAGLQLAVEKTSLALKEAKKAFKETGDEASSKNLEKALESYNKAKNDLRDWGDEAQRVHEKLKNLSDQQSRMGNRAGAGGVMGSLAKAGLGKMFGDSIAGFAKESVTSAFGGGLGNAISSTLSGAITGATIGSVVPVIGTAAGAVVGTVSGLLSAGTQELGSRDEAFKGAIQDQVNKQIERNQTDLTAGSAIAAERETSLVSFSTLFGSKTVAENYLDQMKDMANSTPFLYDDLAAMSKTLKTFGYGVEELIPTMTSIGDTGAALGLGVQDMTAVATSIGRMRSSGKTSLENINQLQDRGIDAIGYLADAKQVSNAKVYEMISRNLIDGAEAAQIISTAMGTNFGGSMDKQSRTYSGMQSTILGLEQEVQAARGEGYNKTRMQGLNEQKRYLSGESGERAKETNRLIGQWEAKQDNEHERMLREAEDKAYRQIEKQKLVGAQAGEVLAAARIDAEAKYMASDGAQLQIKMQKSLVESARVSLLNDHVYEDFGYSMGQEFSKGLFRAMKESRMGAISNFVSTEKGSETVTRLGWKEKTTAPSRAMGMSYVPKNDYPIIAHEGERLLTAQEARSYRKGGGGQPVNVTVNNPVVREEADIYKIASAIYEELRKKALIS